MTPEVGKHEDGGLPRFPSCVNAGCEQKDFRKQELRLGKSITRQYICANCHALLEYRRYGSLGVLVWVTDPSNSKLEDLLHQYFQEVRHLSESFVVRLPPVPKGLHAHVLEGKRWRKLP